MSRASYFQDGLSLTVSISKDSASFSNLQGRQFPTTIRSGYAAKAPATLLLVDPHTSKFAYYFPKSMLLTSSSVNTVYAFWYSVLYQTDSLIKLIETTPITTDLFKESQALYKESLVFPTPNTLDLGFATFVLNRCSHSGILTAGPIGGWKQDGTYTLTERFNKERLIAQIKVIASRKEQITLTGMSYREFLFSYFKPFNDPTTLVFLDPPYVVKGSVCYPTSFALEDHESLRNVVESTLTCPWFMTYDNVDLIKDLYSRYRQEEFSLRYSISQDRPLATERMIFSPNLILKE